MLFGSLLFAFENKGYLLVNTPFIDGSFGLFEGTTFGWPVLEVAKENHNVSVVFITDPYLWLNSKIRGSAWIFDVTSSIVIVYAVPFS